MFRHFAKIAIISNLAHLTVYRQNTTILAKKPLYVYTVVAVQLANDTFLFLFINAIPYIEESFQAQKYTTTKFLSAKKRLSQKVLILTLKFPKT